MDRSFISATKGIQTLLAVDTPGLVADGHFGSFTWKAYEASKSETRVLADGYAKTITGVDCAAIRRAFDVAKTASAAISTFDSPVTQTKLDAICVRVAKAVPVLSGADLSRFVALEAVKRVVNGEAVYNAKSLSRAKKGTEYHGLMQFSKATWDSLAANVELRQRYPNALLLGDWETGAYDPVLAVTAAALYCSYNADTVRRIATKNNSSLKDRKFTFNDYYSMHNQGAGGFMSMVSNFSSFKTKESFVNQSSEARAILTASANA
jgi:hypothetical protein